MHEFSIATAIRQLAARHRPAGSRVHTIHVQIGPLQAVDRAAMQWAWDAVVKGTDYEHAELELEPLPWRLRCPQCGHRWQTEFLDSPCRCGLRAGIPVAGDELVLTQLDITEDGRPADGGRPADDGQPGG